MKKIYEENTIHLDLKIKIKSNYEFTKWFSNFKDINLNESHLDETIIKILKKFHEKDLVEIFFEKIFNEKYYSGCDQYSIALAIVLLKLGYKKEIVLLNSFEIDLEKYNKGKIESAKISEKYAHLGYIPHSFLSIVLGDSKYIINPKYTKIDENKNVVSEISEKYHANFNSDLMIKKYTEKSKKSLLLFEYTYSGIAGFNFKDYPLYIKDKKGEEKIYKTFEKIFFHF